MEILKKPWVKWAGIGFFSLLIVSVSFTFVLRQYFRSREIERSERDKKNAQEEYEDRFRSTMTRVYQNKQLGHFLAAYKNLESLPTPRRTDRLLFEEYSQTMRQVGQGLLENNMLKESESLFQSLRDLIGEDKTSTEALSRIESKKHLERSRLLFAEGQTLFSERRYRDSFTEFQKAQLELDSVDLLNFDDAKDDREKMRTAYKEARFQVLLEDAANQVKDCERELRNRHFKETIQQLSKASAKVGRAAFIHPQDDKVKSLRQKLFDIDAEVQFEIPNVESIWNVYSKDQLEKTLNFFYISDYDFENKADANHRVRVGFKYQMDGKEPYYVVRYRIYFWNGRDMFNGYYLLPADASPNEAKEIIYEQEIPPEFQSTSVKRIELKVFNHLDANVARVTRAFKKPA